MPLTREQAFKVGFLLRCADEGLTEPEIRERVKEAMDKEALLPALAALGAGGLATAGYIAGPAKALDYAVSGGGRLLGAAANLAPVAGIAGLGIPTLGGAGAGYMAAKATSTDSDELEQAKQDEILGEYKRLADEARRNAQRKRLQARTGRKVTLLSPSLH